MGGMRRARQDDRFGIIGVDKGGIGPIIGMDLAKHATLANAAGDQLRHLRAEIDNQNFFMMCGDVCHGGQLARVTAKGESGVAGFCL